MEGANRHLVRCTLLLPPQKKWLLRSKSGVGWMESRLRLVRGRRGGDLGRINGPQLAISSRASHYFSLSLLPPPSSSPPPPHSCIKDLPGLSLPATCHTRSHRPHSTLSHSQRRSASLSLPPLNTHFLGPIFCLCIVTHIRS